MLVRGQGRVLNLDKTLPPANCITNCLTPLHTKQISLRLPQGHQGSDSAISVRLPKSRFVHLPGERKDFVHLPGEQQDSGGQPKKCPNAPQSIFRGRKSLPPQNSYLLSFRGRADGPPFSKRPIPVSRRVQFLRTESEAHEEAPSAPEAGEKQKQPENYFSPSSSARSATKGARTKISIRKNAPRQRLRTPPGFPNPNPNFDHPKPQGASRRPQEQQSGNLGFWGKEREILSRLRGCQESANSGCDIRRVTLRASDGEKSQRARIEGGSLEGEAESLQCANPSPHTLPSRAKRVQAKIAEQLLEDQETSKAAKSRKREGKISRLLGNQEISKAILLSLQEELSGVGRGTDQANMDLSEDAEPGQLCAGKERNAAAHMSPTGDAWDHMNMGAEVKPNPEDELPKPPSWEHCEQDGPEGRVCCDNDPTWQHPNYMGSTKVTEHLAAEVTIEETVATSTEEDMPSPLERLRLQLWKLKTIRNPRKLKSLVQRQATLDSGATSTFMRPQDGAVPTGEK